MSSYSFLSLVRKIFVRKSVQKMRHLCLDSLRIGSMPKKYCFLFAWCRKNARNFQPTYWLNIVMKFFSRNDKFRFVFGTTMDYKHTLQGKLMHLTKRRQKSNVCIKQANNRDWTIHKIPFEQIVLSVSTKNTRQHQTVTVSIVCER